jgi:hypothetical protein
MRPAIGTHHTLLDGEASCALEAVGDAIEFGIAQGAVRRLSIGERENGIRRAFERVDQSLDVLRLQRVVVKGEEQIVAVGDVQERICVRHPPQASGLVDNAHP